METILQLSRRMAHNSSPTTSYSPPHMDMKYSPTESLKLSSRDNNKRIERRKPNWTEAENVFLLDQFGIHREILTCKATDASTNLKKQEIWRLICQNLNTHNTLVRRTPAEVRRKWKNLVTAAKKEVWEMRHQIHLSGGVGTNGRKISELSQRVLQLHSSGGFSSANPNGLYGTLLSAGLIGPPLSGVGGGASNKYNDDDKSYIPAHFTPIITLSESNNNHISLSGHSHGPPSPLSEDDDDESSDSRNATEFMSDSGGMYEKEGIDLRVNISSRNNSVTTNGVGHHHHHHGSNGQSGVHITENGGSGDGVRRHVIIKNNSDDEDEDEVDCGMDEEEDDVEVEDMSLIRFANQLGLREKFGKGSQGTNNNNNNNNVINPFITNALLNNNRNNNNINHNHLNLHHNRRDFEIRESRSGADVVVTPYNASTPPTTRGSSVIPPKMENAVSIVTTNGPVPGNRKSSETTEEITSRPSISSLNGDLLDATLRLRNHFLATLKESDMLSSLYKERLELQIEVLKLRKRKLNQDLENGRLRTTTRGRRLNGIVHKNRTPNRVERRRNHFTSFFRLKPKNTWINFAAKEKLLQEDGDGGVSSSGGKIILAETSEQAHQQPVVMVNVNGIGINGRDQSDPEDDDDEKH